MRKEPRSIELLSPAKDLICGREAINHGADAVYIGAPKFGARAAAGNTLDDIRQLCDYAHLLFFQDSVQGHVNTSRIEMGVIAKLPYIVQRITRCV